MQSQQEKNIFDCLGEEELLKKILPLKQVQKHLIIY